MRPFHEYSRWKTFSLLLAALILLPPCAQADQSLALGPNQAADHSSPVGDKVLGPLDVHVGTPSGDVQSAPGEASREALNVIKQMKELLEPNHPSIRKVVISTSDKSEKAQTVAGMAIKAFPDGNRMLYVMLEPKDVRGVGFLVWEPKRDPSDVMWVYLPSTNRVREIRPIDQFEHFLGTDFTYSDLGFIKLHEHYRILGVEEHVGMPAYKVEEQIPREGWYYSKIVTWIGLQTLLPLERDYYGLNGELWKKEVFQDVSVIDRVPTPLRILMLESGGGRSTELAMNEVDYDVDLPDSMFDPSQLAQVAQQPFWQSHLSMFIGRK